MRALIIGSTLFSDTPKDTDIMCSEAANRIGGFDCITPTESDKKWIFSGALNDHLTPTVNRISGLEGITLFVPSIPLLAHIYRSHLTSFRKLWFKHYKAFHERGFVDICAENEDDRLSQYTREREKEYRTLSNTRSWPLKGMTKSEFFGDNVKYYQEHDAVHEVVAFEDRKPAYTYMQAGDSEVECSRDLWNAMTERRRLNCVKEEMAVIAIERFIAPLYFNNDFVHLNKMKALRGALYKLNTTLSSGWFREFVVMNGFTAYNELLANSDWLFRWLEATESGELNKG